ncbi:hypothetical protein BDW75DRAFT_205847 [Aspergillus navahoensis]
MNIGRVHTTDSLTRSMARRQAKEGRRGQISCPRSARAGNHLSEEEDSLLTSMVKAGSNFQDAIQFQVSFLNRSKASIRRRWHLMQPSPRITRSTNVIHASVKNRSATERCESSVYRYLSGFNDQGSSGILSVLCHLTKSLAPGKSIWWCQGFCRLFCSPWYSSTILEGLRPLHVLRVAAQSIRVLEMKLISTSVSTAASLH